MSGIFPRPGDGTLPPNPNDPGNPIRAYDPWNRPLDTAALYYGNGCDVRLRPEVMNSLISEMAALTDVAELHYDPARQTNIELAVRYISQRGLARYAEAVRNADDNEIPSYYNATLDPRPTRYNDGMVICLVPTHNNMQRIELNINEMGYKKVLRNDGEELKRLDWRVHVPLLIGYFNDAWYMLGLCRSQVPLVGYGTLDVWVRTDGSDETGDGEFNTPESAFRTLQHAWNDVAGRYAPTPTFQINIRMGIPGEYEGAEFSTFGGRLNIIGDLANQDAYMIKGKLIGAGLSSCLGFTAIAFGSVRGVNCLIDQAYPPRAGFGIFVGNNSIITVDSCTFESRAPNSAGSYLIVRSRATMYTEGTFRFRGGNFPIGSVLACTEASLYMNSEGGVWSTFYCDDMQLGAGIFVYNQSAVDLSGHVIHSSNATGPRYAINGMSIIYSDGNQPPGDSAGWSINAGLFVP